MSEEPSAKRSKTEKLTTEQAKPIDNENGRAISATKIFNDPIHGHIELNPVLVRIIDTPQFQRLRRLKQLGVTYYVFPGASHNRFEHSIGTCFLAGELLNYLRQNQPELNITDKDVLCVQIAALCHDLGHGPFSHMFEEVLHEVRPERQWTHEKASIEMFDYMIESNNLNSYFYSVGIDNLDLLFIKELIYGPLDNVHQYEIWQYKGRDISKSFLYEIVSNKSTGIDVDKFDYIARDCHHLGKLNQFDHTRFMKFYRVLSLDNGSKQLCMREKEVKSYYDIYRIREELHRTCYQHPVVNAIGLMLTEALMSASGCLLFRNSLGKYISLSDAVDDMGVYIQLDDNILTLIKHLDDEQLNHAKEILDKVERRGIYSYIGNFQISSKIFPNKIFRTKIDRKIACNEIFKECDFGNMIGNITSDDLVIQAVELTCGNQGQDPLQNVFCYTKENLNKATKVSRDQVSTLLPDKFHEHDVRLYCKNRDRKLCSVIRYAFKHWCAKKGYTVPKGSEFWQLETSCTNTQITSSLNSNIMKKTVTM